MKETKRCIALFSFYDRSGIQVYLEKQAQKGWMLDRISALGWRFHRIEPRKLHVAVVYFSNASAFDPEPSEGQLMFQDYCEHTGWKLAASNAQMQIFYNDTEKPTPIDTDAALEVAAIHASAKKSHLLSYFLLAGVGLLQAALFLSRLYTDPIGVLASNANLFSCFCWMLMLLLALIEIAGYYAWYHRAKAAAAIDGSFVKTRGHRNFQLIILCFMFLAFAFFLIAYGGAGIGLIAVEAIAVVLLITAVIVGASELMKKLKLSARNNRNITIALTLAVSFAVTGILLVCILDRVTVLMPEKTPVDIFEFRGWKQEIYRDDLPLKIEDLIETDYREYSYEIREMNQSFLAAQQVVAQRPRMDALAQPDLDYSITTVKCPLLYSWCKSALLNDFAHNYGRPVPEEEMWETHESIDPEPWCANEAYQLILGGDPEMRFLLCYDRCIVEIDFENDWELTTEQMSVIGRKLGQ